MTHAPNRIRQAQRRPARGAIRRGFTLLEIIVVVTIIALLATLIAPKLLENIWKSKRRIAFTNAAMIAEQVQLYLADNGMSRPPEDFDLTLLTQGKSAQLKVDDLTDPWHNPYVIVVPGTGGSNFDIISFAADGQVGGEGENKDVNSNIKE